MSAASTDPKRTGLEKQGLEDTAPPQSSDQLSKVMSDLPIAIYSCDRNGYITYFNDAAETLWGRRPVTGIDRWCGSWKTYHPNGYPIATDMHPAAAFLKEGVENEGEEIIIERPDNTFRNLLVFPRPIFHNGEISGTHNTLIDITKSKKNAENLTLFSAIVESSSDAIISKNLDGIIISWNTSATRIFGYTEVEAIGQSIHMLIPPGLRDEEDMIITNLRAGRSIDHFETVRLSKDGREIPISLSVSPLKDSKGEVIGASKIARDISEQVEKEVALYESSQRLEMLNTIGKAIASKLDIPDILQLVTDSFRQVTGAVWGLFIYNMAANGEEAQLHFTYSGISEEEFQVWYHTTGQDFYISLLSDDRTRRVDNFAETTGYDPKIIESTTSLGHLPIVSYMGVPVLYGSGEVIGRMSMGHTLPGKFTQAHEELVTSIARQAAVAIVKGRLYAEVKTMNERKDEFIAMAGHELRTPLTSAKGYLQMLEMRDPDLTTAAYIKKSLSQLDKLQTLIEDLLDISQMESGQLKLEKDVFDLVRLVAEVCENIRFSQSTHEVIFEKPMRIMAVEADRHRIEQVLINLLTNAVKYSPKAESVRVSIHHREKEVTVVIKDQGIGLTADQQKNLFQRFYRAQKNSSVRGMGLGLYLSKKILNYHESEITVSSALGKGSKFAFSLPLFPMD